MNDNVVLTDGWRSSTTTAGIQCARAAQSAAVGSKPSNLPDCYSLQSTCRRLSRKRIVVTTRFRSVIPPLRARRVAPP